jgi:hypothetical protein
MQFLKNWPFGPGQWQTSPPFSRDRKSLRTKSGARKKFGHDAICHTALLQKFQPSFGEQKPGHFIFDKQAFKSEYLRVRPCTAPSQLPGTEAQGA